MKYKNIFYHQVAIKLNLTEGDSQMETVFLVLLLVVAVVVANIIYWKFDNIPIAFIQIAVGLFYYYLFFQFTNILN